MEKTMGVDRAEQERLIAMLEEIKERRSRDSLLGFPLHQKQRDFVESVLQVKKKENWFIAANRSGKSDAGAYVGSHLARFGTSEGPKPAIGKPLTGHSAIEVRDRATSGWVSALDFPTSRDVIQPKYFNNGFTPPGQKSAPFIPEHEIEKWDFQAQILKLKNGSIVGFKSADSGRKKYQGAEKDWIHMDEEHPWEIYQEAVIRVGTKPLLFFCTATILPPEGTNANTISWVFPNIIQPFQDGRNKNIGVFGASIYDNPGIPRDEISRLESLYPEGSVARRIRLEGEWLPGLGGSRAYSAFDRSIHAKDLGELSRNRPLCWLWDFNVDPFCTLVGQCFGSEYKIYRELIMNNASIPDMCQLFIDKFPNHGAPIWIYGDATGKKRTAQTAKSDYYLVLNEMKSYGVPIVMKVPEDNPHVPDRVNAVNHLLRDEDGQVRLTVDNACQELILDLEGVMRDDKGGIKKTYKKSDPYFNRTHTSDCLGYWIAYEEPVRPPSVHTATTGASIPRPQYGSRR